MKNKKTTLVSHPSEKSAPAFDTIPQFTHQDQYLFNEGSHFALWEKLGSHIGTKDGEKGAYFSVWAPNARRVTVTGNFNGWNKDAFELRPQESSGVWAGFIPGVKKGDLYKYHIESHQDGHRGEKADPFAVYAEVPPRTASVVWDLDYHWNDSEWMKKRKSFNGMNRPMSMYEVHLGSWRRVPEDNNRSLSYREMAPLLVEHVKACGFTHVELMPVMEHPFFGSWGYQVTGYFAPTSRFGTPQDFMYLIDTLHQNDIGVILDWVPSHFPSDAHGLGYFDGTALYEHLDPKKGFHPDWKSLIFNYGRNEVKSFLISSALFWLKKYHVDGLRVDGVASMLYLDYSRKDGEWTPNEHGGNENLEAISLLRKFNEEAYRVGGDIQTIAEESTAWPMVSRPTYLGGLGFGFKWDMGWMHDTLRYFSLDPIHRQYHQHELSFRMIYAFNENFVLSISHDEVVHGKGSLIGKMPGDDWQQFANLRALYAYMYAMPGKKLLFMGCEFGQRSEWNHDGSLEWDVLQHESHRGVKDLISDLNKIYREEPALYANESGHEGFQWVDASDARNSVYSFLRKGEGQEDVILAVFNLTPVPRENYRIGVSFAGTWKEILNTDAKQYWGSGVGNMGGKETEDFMAHGQPFSISATLPPLSGVFFKFQKKGKPKS